MDIGSLVGTLVLEDHLTNPLDLAINKVKEFAGHFEEAVKGVSEKAGMFGEAGSALVSAISAIPPAAYVAAGALAAVGLEAFHLAEQAAKLGSEMNDMSEKTSIGVPALSNLRTAAIVAGGSLDQVSNSIFMMQRRMQESPVKFAEGLMKIGLSLSSLRALKPEDQFLEIAKAFRENTNETNRAGVAMELFSRQGRDLIPLMMKPLDELVDKSKALGFTWTEEEAKAAEELEMKSKLLHLEWEKIWTDIGSIFIPVLSGLFSAMQKSYELLVDVVSLWGGWHKAILLVSSALDMVRGKSPVGLVPKSGPSLASMLPTGASGFALDDEQLKAIYQESNAQIAESQKKLKKVAEAQQEWNDALEWARDHWEMIGRQVDRAFLSVKNYGDGLAKTLPRLTDSIQGIGAALQGVVTINAGTEFQQNKLAEGPVSVLKAAAANIAATVKGSSIFAGIGTSVPQAILSSFEGGGSAVKSAAGTIGAQIGGNIVTRFGKTITDTLGKTFGGAINAVLPGIGTLAAPLVGLIGKLFGKSEETSRVSPVRDTFFQMQGGLEKLNPLVFQLTGSLSQVDALFKAKTVDQYNAAMKDLQATLDRPAQAMQTLVETAQKYGFTLEELGPTLQRQNLDAQAQTLYQDFQVLTAGLVDHQAILEHMSGSVSEYVNAALKMGTEIPNAMRPMLEDLAANGKLLDANGNQITDLETAGISFSMTMTQNFDRLIESVKELTSAISVGLSGAIAGIPTVRPSVDTSGIVNAPDYTGNPTYEANGGVVYAARGKVIPFTPHGSDTVPAMLTPGEQVLSRSEAQSYNNKPMVIQLIQDGRKTAEVIVPYLPGAVKRMVG